MKKIIAIVAVVILATLALTSLVACEQADYTVGICQLVQHPALDAATQGFKDALQEEMNKAGKTVKFDKQNASGSVDVCGTIVNKFVAGKVDLIMANATPSLATAKNATDTIPILGTSVTEYGIALGMEIQNGIVGGNVSGTCDIADLDRQAQMIIDLIPDAKNVGLLYCASEENSKYQVRIVSEYLVSKGLTCKEYTFSEIDQLEGVTTKAAQESDVIYIPTDNTVAENAEMVDVVCMRENVPVIAGEEGICTGCGVAALCISYYNIGVATGKMAARILLEGADISTMPLEYDHDQVYKYVEERCAKYGITVPDDYVKIEK